MACIDPLKLSMVADGEAPEAEVAEHLVACVECRRAVEEQRRLGRLVGPGAVRSLCPGGEPVARYLDGDAPPEERAAVEAHAADCAPCRRMIFLPDAGSGASAPAGLAARVRERVSSRGRALRIARLAASVAAVLLVGVALWLARAPGGVRSYEHAAGSAEDVTVSLALEGAVTLEGGERFDLTHSATEAYEQRIVRLDGGLPSEVERRHAGSELVVRLRRTPAGKTEIARLTRSGEIELLSVSDNLPIDEACGLLAAEGGGIREEALRRLIGRMLPKSATIESLSMDARCESAGVWRLGGTAALDLAVAQNRRHRIEIELAGALRDRGPILQLDIEARVGQDATLRFAVRRAGR
jgi:anti-sigma factor RsiW